MRDRKNVMEEIRVRQILKPESFGEDGDLYDPGGYFSWDIGDITACLDGNFTADELEAISWWMRNRNK